MIVEEVLLLQLFYYYYIFSWKLIKISLDNYLACLFLIIHFIGHSVNQSFLSFYVTSIKGAVLFIVLVSYYSDFREDFS